MNAFNTHWAGIIGKRALFSRLSLPPHEDRVMEISPSGHHVRFDRDGWARADSYILIELLEAATPDVIDVVTVGDKAVAGKREDFTPEVMMTPQDSANSDFPPEEPKQSWQHPIPRQVEFGHSRFEALCSRISNL